MDVGDRVVVLRSGKAGVIQRFYKAIGGEGVIVKIDDNINQGFLIKEVREVK